MTKRVAQMIYWEPQVAGLCGQHCLNSLLQGPIISAMELAEIAQGLDALEQAAMAEDGVDSTAYLKYMAEDSGNVASDGNFSVQVLSKALEVWDLDVVSINHPDARAKEAKSKPLEQQAFILNLGDHWFSVRKIGETWWNLNSLNKNGPEEISDFYLSLLFETLMGEGYQIFIIFGNLHAMGDMTSDSFNAGSGRWIPCYPKADRQGHALGEIPNREEDGGGGGGGGIEDAIAASLQQQEDDLMAAAIAASMVDSQPAESEMESEDIRAIALSRLLAYPEPESDDVNAYQTQIRTWTGQTLRRAWSGDTPLSALYDFILSETGLRGILRENGANQLTHPVSSSNSIAEEFGGSKRVALLLTEEK